MVSQADGLLTAHDSALEQRRGTRHHQPTRLPPALLAPPEHKAHLHFRLEKRLLQACGSSGCTSSMRSGTIDCRIASTSSLPSDLNASPPFAAWPSTRRAPPSAPPAGASGCPPRSFKSQSPLGVARSAGRASETPRPSGYLAAAGATATTPCLAAPSARPRTAGGSGTPWSTHSLCGAVAANRPENAPGSSASPRLRAGHRACTASIR